MKNILLLPIFFVAQLALANNADLNWSEDASAPLLCDRSELENNIAKARSEELGIGNQVSRIYAISAQTEQEKNEKRDLLRTTIDRLAVARDNVFEAYAALVPCSVKNLDF